MREAAWRMLQELRDQRLEVVVVGTVRKVVGENPEWYQELCATYTSWRRRRHRTIIKRQHTMRVLEALAHERPIRSVYIERMERWLES
jgi:hypothetical protein